MTKRNSVIDFLDTGQQSIQTQDGSKYVGAWKDGKMHGEGELRGEGGMYYKGMFDMGSMHGNGKLIRQRELSSGSSNQTVASVSEILRPVLIDQAPNFAIAHNHPSGDTTPSIPDKILTKNLHKAAQTMGVHLVDHLIIGRPTEGTTGYYSFLGEGRI